MGRKESNQTNKKTSIKICNFTPETQLSIAFDYHVSTKFSIMA